MSERDPDPGRRAALLALLTLGTVSSGLARAQGTGHGQSPDKLSAEPAPKSQDEKWRARHPQPVLVGDLVGRRLLDRNQGTWGWIDAVVRNAGGELLIVFSRARLGLFRGETVALPAKTAALLGPFVMVLDLSDAEVRALQPFTSTGTVPVAPAVRIKMALTKH